MKVRFSLLLLAVAFLAFSGEARAGTIKEETFACRIAEQTMQAAENYVRKKYDSVSCAAEWEKIDAGVSKKCLRIDACGAEREFLIEVYCERSYKLSTPIGLPMEQGNCSDFDTKPP